jgi:hypothetical protein
MIVQVAPGCQDFPVERPQNSARIPPDFRSGWTFFDRRQPETDRRFCLLPAIADMESRRRNFLFAKLSRLGQIVGSPSFRTRLEVGENLIGAQGSVVDGEIVDAARK